MRPDLHDYIAGARWFGGKGRAWSISSVDRLGVVSTEHQVALDLVTARYDDGSVEYYHLPVVGHRDPEDRLAHAHLGQVEDPDFGSVHLYDAVHDRVAMSAILEAFAGEGTIDALAFKRLGDHKLDLEAHSTLFAGEQSNSTVLFGEDAVFKVFRRITPGPNPDITVHEALTRSGSDHVAHLFGWLESPTPPDLDADDGQTLHLGMLQQFLRTASDGWDLAVASVRNLFVEGDLHAEEVGGDFAGEAARLGTALAEVHATLREEFPTAVRDESTTRELAAGMHARLDAALEVVPALAKHEAALRATFDAVGGLAEIAVQQVHGDLHLGQTLRTVRGWKIVDFEGEPAKPLAQRLLPDSHWRDVAGMLRSFDYAPRVVAMTSFAPDSPGEQDQQAYRAGEWAARNVAAFLDAYTDGQALARDEQVMLDAYVADKAVYEAVYEARNRPGWIQIPLAALARMEAS